MYRVIVSIYRMGNVCSWETREERRRVEGKCWNKRFIVIRGGGRERVEVEEDVDIGSGLDLDGSIFVWYIYIVAMERSWEV